MTETTTERINEDGTEPGGDGLPQFARTQKSRASKSHFLRHSGVPKGAYDEPSVDNGQRWAHNDEEQARGGRERVHMDKKTK
jgi:hypothetical protein